MHEPIYTLYLVIVLLSVCVRQSDRILFVWLPRYTSKLTRAGHTDRALRLLEWAGRMPAWNGERMRVGVRMQLGEAYFKAARYTDAVAQLKYMLSAGARTDLSARAHYLLSSALEKLNQPAEAQAARAAGIADAAGDARYLAVDSRAKMLDAEHRYAEAAVDYVGSRTI